MKNDKKIDEKSMLNNAYKFDKEPAVLPVDVNDTSNLSMNSSNKAKKHYNRKLRINKMHPKDKIKKYLMAKNLKNLSYFLPKFLYINNIYDNKYLSLIDDVIGIKVKFPLREFYIRTIIFLLFFLLFLFIAILTKMIFVLFFCIIDLVIYYYYERTQSDFHEYNINAENKEIEIFDKKIISKNYYKNISLKNAIMFYYDSHYEFYGKVYERGLHCDLRLLTSSGKSKLIMSYKGSETFCDSLMLLPAYLNKLMLEYNI